MTPALRDKLHPDVLALVRLGKLHPFDCEWIGNLPRERQLAAARKCTTDNLTVYSDERRYRGRVR